MRFLFADQADRYMRRTSLRDFRERERRLRTVPFRPGDAEATIAPPFRPKRLKRYEKLITRAGAVLAERGAVTLRTNGHPLALRLVRFRDGTAVLETRYGTDQLLASGRSRIDRGEITPDTMARNVMVALLDHRVRPIAGQKI